MDRHEKHKRTVEARQKVEKAKFLEELRKTPIVTVAARRAGISPATAYRWKEESSEFAFEFETAVREGKNLVSDMAESKAVEKIRDGYFPAVRYWLDRHREPFKPAPKQGTPDARWTLADTVERLEREREEEDRKENKDKGDSIDGKPAT